MPKIRISADSTCDLSPELVEKYNIAITPLKITLGDTDYTDQIDITPQKIYDYVAETGVLPKTAAVSVGTYTDVFTELKKDCDEVVHFTISSEMSSCYQNAVLAAEEVGGVYVVDSRNLSTGIGHLAIEAAIAAQDETKTGKDVFDYVSSLVDRLDVSFVINSVNYLYKGGRCSGVAAVGANLLKLKPLIEVHDGKMDMAGKYRGNMKDVVKKYITDRLTVPGAKFKRDRIFVTCTCTDYDLPNYAKEIVESLGLFDEVLITIAGSTITSHCGKDTLGILYINE
ncbi:MAG: DegV family protein [Eubacteriales bacterium]|nr:DegV family protein [Eubacteriales bacterium]MDY3760160.1 DegV family protein [Eubacteriales bacterium]